MMKTSRLSVTRRIRGTLNVLSTIGLVLFLVLGLVAAANTAVPTPAFAAGTVAPLDEWPATPQMTATTGDLAGSFAISEGTQRLLVVLVCSFDSAFNSGQTFTAAYGGKTLSQAMLQNDGERQTWIGYLKETDIASRTGDGLAVTVAGNHTNAVAYVASYSGVDQTAPITAANGISFSNLNNQPIGGPLAVNAGGYGIYGWSGVTTRTSDDEAYAEHSDVDNPGTFDYGVASNAFSAAGTTNPTVVWAGSNYVSVSFVTLNPGSSRITPAVIWDRPDDIVYGTTLSNAQLCATASVQGTFAYAPDFGALLSAGTSQTLHVDFTPTDTSTYNPTSQDVTINVKRAPLTITASDQIKTYGDVTAFKGTEFTAVGLVGNDKVDSVTLTSAGADSDAAVATYSIVPSAAVGTGLNNYTINYCAGSLAVNETKASPSVIFLSNASITGNWATLTATVTGAGATGTVTFRDGYTTLGSSSLTNGTATFTTPTLSAGSHSITAVYSGDANFAGSTSSEFDLTLPSPAGLGWGPISAILVTILAGLFFLTMIVRSTRQPFPQAGAGLRAEPTLQPQPILQQRPALEERPTPQPQTPSRPKRPVGTIAQQTRTSGRRRRSAQAITPEAPSTSKSAPSSRRKRS